MECMSQNACSTEKVSIKHKLTNKVASGILAGLFAAIEVSKGEVMTCAVACNESLEAFLHDPQDLTPLCV